MNNFLHIRMFYFSLFTVFIGCSNLSNSEKEKVASYLDQVMAIKDDEISLVVLKENSCDACYKGALYLFKKTEGEKILLISSTRTKAKKSDFSYYFDEIPEKHLIINDHEPLVELLVSMTQNTKGPYLIKIQNQDLDIQVLK